MLTVAQAELLGLILHTALFGQYAFHPLVSCVY